MIPALSTGYPELDLLISGDTDQCRGFPEGSISQFWGPPDLTFALTALDIVRESVERSKKKVVVLDFAKRDHNYLPTRVMWAFVKTIEESIELIRGPLAEGSVVFIHHPELATYAGSTHYVYSDPEGSRSLGCKQGWDAFATDVIAMCSKDGGTVVLVSTTEKGKLNTPSPFKFLSSLRLEFSHVDLGGAWQVDIRKCRFSNSQARSCVVPYRKG